MQIHELTGATSVSNNDVVALDTQGETKKASISAIASQIIRNYKGPYLNSVVQTVKAAIDSIGAKVSTHETKIADLEAYAYFRPNDTETFGTPARRILEAGFVTSSGSRVYFDVITPKLTTNVTQVTCTQLVGRLRGVNGPLSNMTSDIDYRTSGYSVSATIAGSNRVAITIEADTAFTNITNNTPISFHGVITLAFS